MRRCCWVVVLGAGGTVVGFIFLNYLGFGIL
jgi:hypothetical protein